MPATAKDRSPRLVLILGTLHVTCVAFLLELSFSVCFAPVKPRTGNIISEVVLYKPNEKICTTLHADNHLLQLLINVNAMLLCKNSSQKSAWVSMFNCDFFQDLGYAQTRYFEYFTILTKFRREISGLVLVHCRTLAILQLSQYDVCTVCDKTITCDCLCLYYGPQPGRLSSVIYVDRLIYIETLLNSN